MNTVKLIAASVVCGSMFLALPVHATDFATADANAVRSLTQGVGVAALPILSRQAGSVEATISTLTQSLCKSNCASVNRANLSDRIRVTGATWHLDVFGDGTMAEYADDSVRTRAQAAAVADGSSMSQASLEAAGRAYVANVLAGTIVLGSGETLEADLTSARRHGGSDRAGNVAPVVNTGNRVVFRRRINGIPILGAGSKIAITFLNDGSVESFRYDWPTYAQTGQTQSTALAGDVLQRVQQVVGVRSGSLSTAVVAVPASPTSSTRIDLGGNIQLERLACGYYDAGLLNRSAVAPVQAGCYYHAVHVVSQSGATLTAAFAGAVPGAVQALPDDSWPEERLLRGVSASGAQLPGSAATPTSGSVAAPSGK